MISCSNSKRIKYTVAHFIRKDTQLKSSFIQNQITNHIQFNPIVISKYRSEIEDGGFADFDNKLINHYNLWDECSLLGKKKYRYLKLISKYDIKKIRNILRKNSVDILHFHFGTDAGIYFPFIKKNNCPSVVSFYGYDCSEFPKMYYGYGKYYLNKRVFPYVTKVLAMSDNMKQDLIRIGCPEHKIITHYYGTDVVRFSGFHEYKKNDIINFTIISGLSPKKGHVFLLKAFNEAYKKNQNLCLTIVGDGKIRREIKSFINLHNMNYVQLLDRVIYASKDHKKYLSDADVFIHPSVIDKKGDKEGIPGAIVEAMAAGLPVISTWHSGIPCIIKNNETGVLVNEWDIVGLTNAILKLANNADQRKKIGLSGQEHVLNNLNIIEKEKELEDIYEKILCQY